MAKREKGSESGRDRVNNLILYLERFAKSRSRKREEDLKLLGERVDTELRLCFPEMRKLPRAEFVYLLNRLIRLLQSIGLVVIPVLILTLE